MSYAISGECCSDASCVAVCPMNCIHPSPGEPRFGAGASLFIDPRTCIDCGACADICPVDAAKPVDQSAPEDVERNAAYYADREPLDGTDLDAWQAPAYQTWGGGPRRVLVVGAGPAGMYATRELLLRTTAEVTLVDRLAEVGGLARFGVAPDHPRTRQIISTFERIAEHPRVRWRPGTDAAGLASGYDAVIHAVGAYQSRRLGIPGEEAACAAEDFVAWYNDRPGAVLPVELTGPRAVVVGNGNVALDLARVLLSDETRLAQMELRDDVRRTLAASGIREVVLLGRRGPEEAAYTASALDELSAFPGAQLRFNARPTRWSEAGLELDTGETIAAGNLFTAIGFEGKPVAGLPFDAERGVVPNVRGAVVDRPGQYVAGWIKRGARGGIGINKACAQETVLTMLATS
ncbi:FAD-dependent oxidoreductase [Kribbella sp. NPDC051952]|uniref:FAD-dependent oxidoreductase n=1 Tax=Kribbella sp. NPDC051952 TaxID=3154851 RepID=UPI00342AB281